MSLHPWQRYQALSLHVPSLSLLVDLSKTSLQDDALHRDPLLPAAFPAAFAAMEALEAGAIANPDEGRMVGHYWLRNPALSPTPEIRGDIEACLSRVKTFAADVHAGAIAGERGQFKNLLLIGIGGSALGPPFVAHALGDPIRDRMRPY